LSKDDQKKKASDTETRIHVLCPGRTRAGTLLHKQTCLGPS